MKTQIIFATLLLLSLTLVSATTMCEDTCYAGETYTINATESFDHWSFVGNENNMSEDDLTIIQNADYSIDVTLNKYMKANSFELTFFNKEVVTEYHYSSGGGGGSSRTKYIDKIEYVPYEVPTEVEVEKIVEVEVPGEVVDKGISFLKVILWSIFVILGLWLMWVLMKYYVSPSAINSNSYKEVENNEKI